MQGDFPIEEIEDPDLYYKYVKSRDQLVPYEKMIYRFNSNRAAHIEAIETIQEQVDNGYITFETYCILYDWHAELAQRADNRMRHFMELAALEEYDDKQQN